MLPSNPIHRGQCNSLLDWWYSLDSRPLDWWYCCCSVSEPQETTFLHVVLPGVYLASEFPHPPPTRRGELSHEDKGGFWPVSPGGGRDGAVMFLGGRGTFHSSWAREVFVTEPGDHVNLESLFLATRRRKTKRGRRERNAFRRDKI